MISNIRKAHVLRVDHDPSYVLAAIVEEAHYLPDCTTHVARYVDLREAPYI